MSADLSAADLKVNVQVLNFSAASALWMSAAAKWL